MTDLYVAVPDAEAESPNEADPRTTHNAEAIALLRAWTAEDRIGDHDEQAASWAQLVADLNEDRLSDRLLFE